MDWDEWFLSRLYGYDPEGDPLITMGADPYRVYHMTDPREMKDNWGTYYSDDDEIYLNPTLPKEDYQETALHEFRHRGVNQLGLNWPFSQEEYVMRLYDLEQGIGTPEFNRDYLTHQLWKDAKTAGGDPDKAVIEALYSADTRAKNWNEAARAIVGGGREYQSPLDQLMRDLGLR